MQPNVFLVKPENLYQNDLHPTSINTDKNTAYSRAIKQLKVEGKCRSDLKHRQVKYLNNIIELIMES